MSKFGARRARRKAAGGDAAVEGKVVDGEQRKGRQAAADKGTRTDGKSSPAAGGGSVTSTGNAAQPVAVDFERLGEHVGTVLEAAKAAAEKMRVEASIDARQIRADARLQARVELEEAQKKVARADAEAARLLAEAKQRSDETREEADDYAASTRQAADAEAAVILEDADQLATDRVDSAQKRQRTLDRNIAATENRLRQLVGGVRELASGLEELVPATSLPQQAAVAEPDVGSLTGTLTQAAAGHRSSLRLPEQAEDVAEELNGN
jgi:hypothetical protein